MPEAWPSCLSIECFLRCEGSIKVVKRRITRCSASKQRVCCSCIRFRKLLAVVARNQPLHTFRLDCFADNIITTFVKYIGW